MSALVGAGADKNGIRNKTDAFISQELMCLGEVVNQKIQVGATGLAGHRRGGWRGRLEIADQFQLGFSQAKHGQINAQFVPPRGGTQVSTLDFPPNRFFKAKRFDVETNTPVEVFDGKRNVVEMPRVRKHFHGAKPYRNPGLDSIPNLKSELDFR